MSEQLEAINKYYNNLEYDDENRKKEALVKISNLSKTITLKDHISDRFLEAASVIEKNLSLFQFACEHVDVVTTIIEYLTTFGAKMLFDNEFDEMYLMDDVMLTLLNVCEESSIQLFLEETIMKNFILNGTIPYEQLEPTYIKDQSHQMILLEDSDLYAVINYLKAKESFSSCSYEIWVQGSIKEKFLWLVKKYLKNLTFAIHGFNSRKSLLLSCSHNKMKIVSIWTEDIIAAKNLATSIKKEVLFINSHMDLGGNVLLPYGKIFDKTLNTMYEWKDFNDESYEIKDIELKSKKLIYNLFYDGKWQQPVKNTYWIYNETLWAHATNYDIKRCIDSAEKGFKIWSIKSIVSRKQILSKFAFELQSNGNFLLAERVLKWVELFSYFDQTLSVGSQCKRLEIMTTHRKPRGVIILKEKDETALFDLLTQILITGNSVIVICDGKNSCSIEQYCLFFSLCGIPSGVINLLSNDKMETLEVSLCTSAYDLYAERFFVKHNPKKTYLNLTIPEHVILPIN
ncbi:uncharacterized protein LOC114941513 [Nylanderia fulva]|uniref:uncharacterized protein LOC114941513 n=1 Tax=Nylanderia fulva TaxID=613905 RepID=UPI0010FAF6EE|nr:uncharacterized protein LOC114941513 [Nylanderia fulva]XP_029172374.1 uncharacterized protein LOC114941513 [Nylanderia fulva]